MKPLDPALLEFLVQRTKTASELRGHKICIYSDQGVGKTVLAAKLGTSNLFVTDEPDGLLSLQNHSGLDEKSSWIPFTADDNNIGPDAGVGYKRLAMILQACENGQYPGKNGGPINHVILDTVSGMVEAEITRSIKAKEVKAEGGALADNIPTRPHYLLSEQNFLPVMRIIAQMTNCSVTMNVHLRTGDKSVPGASTRPDLHGAVYKALARYVSVMGYMHMSGPNARQIRIMPDQMTAAKTRLNFGKAIMTDSEFVEAITNWKAGK